MAALLRQGAARRLGGSMVQRAQAAVAEERRQIVPRRFLSGGQHARPGPPKDPQACLHEIQERKEELYDLITLMEETSLPKKYQNRELLKFLSVQIKPRPEDSQWRRMRQSKKSKDLTETTILVSTCILGYQYWSSLAGGKEVARTAKKQEE